MSRKTPPVVDLDLDAIAAELDVDGTRTLRFRGVTFTVPSELPADVLLPLIDPELDLVGVFGSLMVLDDDGKVDEVIDGLLSRSSLASDLWQAFMEALRRLFGDEQLQQLQDTRPSLQAYVRLVKGLWRMYGVGLGEASQPSSSSENTGGSPKETSNSTTE